MNTQAIISHLRRFLERAGETPYRGDRLVPAARNLLRLAKQAEKEGGGDNESLRVVIHRLEDWLSKNQKTRMTQ